MASCSISLGRYGPFIQIQGVNDGLNGTPVGQERDDDHYLTLGFA